MAKRYIEWDFESNKAAEYKRTGECNGCGQCCVALIRYRVARFKGRKTDNWGRLGCGANNKGTWYEVRDGKRRRAMQHIEIAMRPREEACPSLNADNKCGVHSEHDWKRDIHTLCDVWPINPEQVKAFSECSFSFEKIAEWDIEASGK